MDIPAPRAPSDAATAATRRGGVLDAPVPEGPARTREVPCALTGPRGEASERSPPGSRPRKAAKRFKGARARTADRRRWAGRAYRGDRANRGQGTRQNCPVTSGEGALLQKGSRSEEAQATVYQKHRTVLKARADVYRLTPARCRKVTRSRQRKRSGDAKPR